MTGILGRLLSFLRPSSSTSSPQPETPSTFTPPTTSTDTPHTSEPDAGAESDDS